MICKNTDCQQEIDHEQEARLRTTENYLEVIVDCPHCGTQHYTSLKPEELIVAHGHYVA